MSGTSAIEWTEATWNPVTGCSKVSAGCDHCYAEALTMRHAENWGVPRLPWTPENASENVILRPSRLDVPEHWRKPRMVFVNSMSDMFHPRVPGDYVGQVFDVMGRCSQHTFQILTKRPKRMRDWCRQHRPEPLPNVWLGTSIESNEWVQRADLLRETPAAVRFVSAEPLLGPLWSPWQFTQFGPLLDLTDIDWLIVGGESGPNHRQMRERWVLDLLAAARESGTAFFFKQWGGRTPKAGGRELGGRTYSEMPSRVAVCWQCSHPEEAHTVEDCGCTDPDCSCAQVPQ